MPDFLPQLDYWNQAAGSKTFTHPLDIALLERYVERRSSIVDYGCGYGRLCVELRRAGFSNVLGVDFSDAMVGRARQASPGLPYEVIVGSRLPRADATVDCVLLFAVLTCIPSRTEQEAIVAELERVLAAGGIVYLSDYLLQSDARNVGRYSHHRDGTEEYGTFTTDDGAIVRHHTPEWLNTLLPNFEEEHAEEVGVTTMNGHHSQAFQAIYRKRS